MAKVEDLKIKIDSSEVKKAKRAMHKYDSMETILRRKCKHYRKYIKGLHRGIKWRNEVIVELAFRNGMTEEDVKGIVKNGFDYEQI